MKKIMGNRYTLILLLFTLFPYLSPAEEGMWIPSLLEHYNIDIMQERGLRLSAEDIYSINQASIKDGVVIFGRGCTGGVISGNGLVITNHHCGFGAIQSLSTVEQDYLTNGYWAMSLDEELPAPGLSVVFLIRIEDVTAKVLEGIDDEMSEDWRKSRIESGILRITGEAVKGTQYNAIIKPFFYGNEYYMFVYEEYRDVRLVGAPPSSIGNFGADPDNWIWPRHTGDFGLFRIYADADNMPASYSLDNVPYSSKKVIPISTAGYKENDFTMILGYPGATTQYLISPDLEMIYKTSLVHKIKLRDKRMEIMDKYMKDSNLVKLQYASKYRSVSNAWKKWQGVIRGLDRIDGVAVKKQQEKEFAEWVAADEARKARYGMILPGMYKLSEELNEYSLVYDYSQECVMATEIFSVFIRIDGLIAENKFTNDQQKVIAKEWFLNSIQQFFKDYHLDLDKETFSVMLKFYFENIDEKFHPYFFADIHKKYKGNYERFASDMFNKSSLVSYYKIEELFAKYPENESNIRAKILKDPLYKLFLSYSRIYRDEVYPRYDYVSGEMERNYRLYVEGLREMNPDQAFYPDANFTMRLTHGKIEGYEPADAVYYHYQSRIEGKIEKFNTGLNDYQLSDRFVKLFEDKDYGRWADKDGNLYACFIASNHTSGGNSGSPVMNGHGQLIGINFDRNWEGTMNDFIYDPSQCRNISVDIRYILFIMDKYAGAGHLIDEMELVN